MDNKQNNILGQHDYYDDVRLYTKAIEAEPQNALAYQGLAKAYLETKQFEKAKQNCEKVIELDPNLAIPYVILAHSNYRLGEGIEQTYQLAEKGYNLAPDMLEAINCFGSYSLIIGKYEQGIELLNKSLSIDPYNYVTHSNLYGAYLKLKKPEMAYKEIQKMYKIKPSVEAGYLLFITFINLKWQRRIYITIFIAGFLGGILIKPRILLIVPALFVILGIINGFYDLSHGTKKMGVLRIFAALCLLLLLVLIFFRLK